VQTKRERQKESEKGREKEGEFALSAAAAIALFNNQIYLFLASNKAAKSVYVCVSVCISVCVLGLSDCLFVCLSLNFSLLQFVLHVFTCAAKTEIKVYYLYAVWHISQSTKGSKSEASLKCCTLYRFIAYLHYRLIEPPSYHIFFVAFWGSKSALIEGEKTRPHNENENENEHNKL